MRTQNHLFKQFLVIVFVLSFGLLSKTQAQSANSLLWKIQGNGIEDSYLFGTFHVMPQADFELKDKVKDALLASDHLVMELDMSNPNMQVEIMQNASMKQGMTIDKLLSKKDYKRLDKMLKETVGAGAEQMNSFKPFMLSSLLLKRFVGEQPASFESVLSAIAVQQKMKIGGLETTADQMSLFDKISYSDQASDLVEMMDNEEETMARFSKMVSLYKEEKLEQLYNETSNYFDRPGELELILLNRNQKWISPIGEMAADQSTFFAVGAGHLGGEKGLISLLKKEGYTLTPVN